MKFIYTSLFLLFTIYGYAQDTTRSIKASNFNPRVDSIAEHLVAMASVNPRIISLENVAKQYEYQYKRSKTAWLNNIAIAGNLNEFSLHQGNTADPLRQSTQFPRYNVGVIIPLGLFLNNGKQTKSDYYRYESILDQIRIEKQNIRREVLVYYQKYILNKQLLALQEEVLQDAKVLLKKHEDDFKNQRITLEVYMATNKIYNTEQEKEVSLDNEIRLIEVELEALIGMNLLDALDLIKAQLGIKD